MPTIQLTSNTSMSVTTEEAQYLMSLGCIEGAIYSTSETYTEICRRLEKKFGRIKLFFSIEEASKMLRVAQRTVYKLIEMGKLTRVKNGITRESLIEYGVPEDQMP